MQMRGEGRWARQDQQAQQAPQAYLEPEVKWGRRAVVRRPRSVAQPVQRVQMVRGVQRAPAGPAGPEVP